MADARPESWERLLKADEDLLVWVLRRRLSWLSPVMRGFTRMGDGSTWAAVGLALLALPETRMYGAAIGWATVCTSIVVQIAKRLCRRARPELGEYGLAALVDHPDRFSFPSGHTAAAVSVAVALANAPGSLGPLCALLAGGVAFSRVYLGAHYPLDVAVGGLMGAMVGAAVAIGLF